MEYILALAIIGLFVLELAHREKTRNLQRGVVDLTSRVNAMSAAAGTQAVVPTTMSAAVADSVSGATARVPDDRGMQAAASVAPVTEPARTLLEPAADVLAEALPEVAAAGAVVTLGLQQRRRASPYAQWFRKVRGSEEWEALIGGRLMNRVGAIALILAMGFFLKYAIDQNWIGQSARVGIGVAVGAGLLALAHRAHRRGYAVFGQGLVGAGQAVVYLSVFAAYNFYQLVPQPIALAAMGAVTALGFAEGLYYDSPAVAVLASIGGYLAPFLLLSHGSGPAGTVVYLVALNAGVLALLAHRPRWWVLEPMAMTATYAAFFTWFATGYTTDQIVLAASALSLFWALFLAHEVRNARAGAEAPLELRHTLGVVNGLAYLGGLFGLLAPSHPVVLAASVLALGSVYAAVLVGSMRRDLLGPGAEVRYGLSAIALLVLATPIALRGFPVVMLWSLEAAALLFVGVYWSRRHLWQTALGIYALAFTLLFATPGALGFVPIDRFVPLLNLRDLAYLVLIGALAAGAVAVSRLTEKIGDPLRQSLHYAWTGAAFIFLAVETGDVFHRAMLGVGPMEQTALDFDRSLAVALVWMVFSLVLGAWGWKTRVTPWVVASLTAAGLAAGLTMIAGITFRPIEEFVPVLNVRVLAFALIAAGLALHLRRLGRTDRGYAFAGTVRVLDQLVLLTLGFELILAEVNDFFMHRAGRSLLFMDAGGLFTELTILAALWMLYSLLPTWFGVKQRSMALVALGLSMTASATGVAALGGIAFSPSHALATALGIRPIVLTIVVTGLLAQLRWLRKGAPDRRRLAPIVVGLQAAIILLGFGLISAETRDAFALAAAHVPAVQVGALQNLEGLAFSLVWLGYAIGVMALGIWRRARWMRLGAMALLAGVVLKVFIYDLSFLGTAYRPASFAGLGVVLLAVSFLYQKYRSALFESR
jgi:uncharacterized membrane protein